MSDDRLPHDPWPLRAAILLAAGMGCGLLFHFLVRGDEEFHWSWTQDSLRLAAATFVVVAGVLFAFTLERLRWHWSLAFALGAGLVVGAIFYWSGDLDSRGADAPLQFLASLAAVAIAAPLFQTIRDEGGRRLPYPSVLAHCWANLVLWALAWAFVLAVFLMLVLLGALFDLIGIDLLADAISRPWFVWPMVGGALGAAAGLLRDRDRILGLIQRVVTNVLSVLAPVLAVGLVLFVLALPFTGLQPLWEETSATTPILLFCAVGAVILANAVIGNAPEEEAGARVLRWSAAALAGVILPLVIVAAVSTWLRIDQYGFTPERLWALVAVLVAAAVGLVYLAALLLGRAAWPERVRQGNVRLALGMCLLALFLATPLAAFGRISADDQLARLRSGAVAPAEFDWTAMRFDFGPAGVRTLERLRDRADDPAVRRLAARALAADNRWLLAGEMDGRRPPPPVPEQAYRVVPAGTPIPAALQARLPEGVCVEAAGCVLVLPPGRSEAILAVANPCAGKHQLAGQEGCAPAVRRFVSTPQGWAEADESGFVGFPEAGKRAESAADGRIELRPVRRRQLYLDGEPLGEPFE